MDLVAIHCIHNFSFSRLTSCSLLPGRVLPFCTLRDTLACTFLLFVVIQQLLGWYCYLYCKRVALLYHYDPGGILQAPVEMVPKAINFLRIEMRVSLQILHPDHSCRKSCLSGWPSVLFPTLPEEVIAIWVDAWGLYYLP